MEIGRSPWLRPVEAALPWRDARRERQERGRRSWRFAYDAHPHPEMQTPPAGPDAGFMAHVLGQGHIAETRTREGQDAYLNAGKPVLRRGVCANRKY